MKFLEAITKTVEADNGLHLELDFSHSLTLKAVTPTIVRVFLRKDRKPRLARTWSIAQGAHTVPWEGLPREALDFGSYKVAVAENEDAVEMCTSQLKVRVHKKPYHLEWSHIVDDVWSPLLSERTTGAVALGRRDHRIWHFHKLAPEARFFGLGEKTGELNRRGRKFEMRNVDPMGYDARSSDPLYKHFPFYIEERNGVHYGLFYDNLATCTFDFGQEIDNYHGPFTSYRAQDGDLDFYLILGPTLLDVCSSFHWLTGKTYLPPRWSFGYSSTSMTYTDVPQAQERLGRFIEQVIEHRIPVKSFKYGSGYTSRDGKRYVFTWNRDKFPDPETLNARFHQHRIRLSANVKPVLLHDHPSYREAVRDNLFVRDSEVERQEISRFWDDSGSHLDFSNPATIAWWQEQAEQELLDRGFDGLWNDNNEYVVWDEEARCHGFGEELPIGVVRPLMSLWMTRASHELMQRKRPGMRVWSMTRCGCPGMQRYAQTWSGDNLTAWPTLEYNLKMALGLSMSGINNIGHDVGGFAGPPPDPEFLVRSYQLGVFHPRFGVNSWKEDGTITEPWMYPEQLDSIRRTLELRMQLMPQLYSLFLQCREDFTPFLRPTFMNFPDDPECYVHDTELMWGETLLAAPVLHQGAKQRDVYLPHHPAGWYDFHSGQHHPGGRLIACFAPPHKPPPMLVRGGSFLFLAQPGADSIDGPELLREVRVYPGNQGDQWETVFFDDDGESEDYKEGQILELELRAVQSKRGLDIQIRMEGDYRPSYKEIRFVLPEGADDRLELTVNGEPTNRFPLEISW